MLRVLYGDTGGGWVLVESKHAEYGIAINPRTAESRYWQKHVDYILAISASLLLCERPSAASILSNVKYTSFPLNCSNLLPIILRWLYCVHFKMWHIKCRKFNANNVEVTKDLFYKRKLWHENILHVPTNITAYEFAWLGYVSSFIPVIF